MSNKLNNKLKKLKLHLSKSNLIFSSVLAIILFASVGAYMLLISNAASSSDADFNNSGKVDITDLSILASNWGKTNMTHSKGDANNDNTVNILDLSILATYYGQSAVVSPTPTTTPIPTPIVQPTFNVMDYGAKGNGTNNDQPAIQTAINAANAAGGGIVYLPAGTYKLSSTANINGQPGVPAMPEGSYNLALRDNVYIKGASRSQTIVIGGTSNSHPFGGDHVNNIGVSHLTVTTTASSVDGVKFLQCSHVTITDVLAHDLYIGLALYSCHDSIIKDSRVENNGMGFVIGEADVVGYDWVSSGISVVNGTAAGNDVNYRVRSAMKSPAAPYVRRPDYPYYGGNVTFQNCTGSPANKVDLMVTDSHNITATGMNFSGVIPYWFENSADTNVTTSGGSTLVYYDTVNQSQYGYMPSPSNNYFNGVKKN